nr:hypothetical protein Iba_chr15aCG11460 [Ipomoea batatas]
MANTVVEFAEVMAEIGKHLDWRQQKITQLSPHNLQLHNHKQQIQTPPVDLGVSSPQPAPEIDIPAAMEQQHQDQFNANELQNIARDLEQDSEKTISDGEQLDTTPSDNTMKEFFDSEELFEYAGYYLNRDTFQSMRAGELENVLVDV